MENKQNNLGSIRKQPGNNWKTRSRAPKHTFRHRCLSKLGAGGWRGRGWGRCSCEVRFVIGCVCASFRLTLVLGTEVGRETENKKKSSRESNAKTIEKQETGLQAKVGPTSTHSANGVCPHLGWVGGKGGGGKVGWVGQGVCPTAAKHTFRRRCLSTLGAVGWQGRGWEGWAG